LPELASLIAALTGGDDGRAEAAVPSLARLGAPALHTILQLLDHDDADHRWWAVRALAEFDDPASTRGLCNSLSDPEASVRQCAALALRHKPAPQAILPLSNALEGEDRLFTRLVGDALSACGKLAIPALERCLTSPDPAIRGEAARALALMEQPETIPVLFSAAEDPSAIVQHWIEEGFNRLGVGMVFFNP
jgi:HEAT repeat protein